MEFPDLEREIWQRFGDDVVIIGADPGGLMGGDTDAILQQFVNQTGITFPVGIDVDRTYRDYAVGESISPFPLDVIIGADGRIEYLSREFDIEAMVAVVERLLR